MRIAPLAALCSIPALLGIAALHLPSGDERYYVIDGPDYREVDRAAFDERKPFCARISERDYPDSHLIVHHCERAKTWR